MPKEFTVTNAIIRNTLSTLGANIADFNESLNLHTEEPFGVRRIPGKGMRGLGGSGGDTTSEVGGCTSIQSSNNAICLPF